MIIAVASREYLERLKNDIEDKILESGPIFVEVAKTLIPEFVAFISKGFFLYRPVADKGDSVVYVVSLPENYLKYDKEIMKYSAYLLDPEVLKVLIRRGKHVESGVVGSPRLLIRYFKEWSLTGRKLVLLVSTRLPVKGVIFFMKQKVRGAWVDAVDVYLGSKAVRILMYYGPYKYVVFEV